MNRYVLSSLLLLLTTVVSAQNTYQLIPFPARFAEKPGQFTFKSDTKLVLAATDPAAKAVAQNLVSQLNTATALSISVVNATPATSKGANVFVTLLKDSPWGYDGYQLKVSTERISIEAESTKGLFYATQTLLQLLPAEIYGGKKLSSLPLSVPACDIQDRPRFSYRGMHLDVARHFYPVSFIKKYIDLMAIHKMTHFHWHLTDDQGWRIEIKKYPKLTQVGSKRKETTLGHYDEHYPMKFDGKEYGGFYTQEEIKDIVRYAQARFITIIPEIEMPGHASAALAAYPEFGCGPGPYAVQTKWGVFDNLFCPTDKTFKFLEEVLTEVMALFPGKYLHIGGDECPKKSWKESKVCQDIIKKNKLKDENELQSFFVKRIEKFLNSKGRVLIGWDEILDGGVAPNATIMSWRGNKGGIDAAKQNHDVIMTPTDYCYFDYYQANPDQEPLAIGGYLPIEKVYSFEPVPGELIEAQAKKILGAQANVWTEYLKTPEEVEYMVWPRATALAEVLWAQPGSKNFEDFLVRLKFHQKRLDQLKVNYARVLTDVQAKASVNTQGQLEVRLDAVDTDTKVFYTLDGKEPTSNKANEYIKPIAITKSTTLKTISMPNGRKFEQRFSLHKGFGKKYTFATAPTEAINAEKILTDGVQKTNPRNHSGWVRFDGTDMEVIVDLNESEVVRKVSMSFLKIIADNCFPPTSIEVVVSKDGKDFKDPVTLPVSYDLNGPWKVEPVEINLKNARGRYVRIKAKNAGTCPPNHPNSGESTWFALDEIVIE